jgi:hypothetical protein
MRYIALFLLPCVSFAAQVPDIFQANSSVLHRFEALQHHPMLTARDLEELRLEEIQYRVDQDYYERHGRAEFITFNCDAQWGKHNEGMVDITTGLELDCGDDADCEMRSGIPMGDEESVCQ